MRVVRLRETMKSISSFNYSTVIAEINIFSSMQFAINNYIVTVLYSLSTRRDLDHELFILYECMTVTDVFSYLNIAIPTYF